MIPRTKEQAEIAALRSAPFILFAVLFLLFGLLEPKFISPATFTNIVTQASYIGIMAVGMTFVLLVAGIDLSVGSVMYLSATVGGGWLLADGFPIPVAVAGALLVGLAVGTVNAFLITRVGVIAFLTTLAMLVVVRGLALTITKSEAITFPDEITRLGSTRILGLIPAPIVIFLSVVVVGHIVLTRTAFGRQVYAVGNDKEAASKAGINVGRLIASVYIVCGVLASLGGIVNVVQLGSVHPSFGEGIEFDVIAACVLGGVSLFGGRGSVFPGAVIGALFVPMINAGLQAIDVEIYLRAPAFAVVIFIAVLMDSLRNRQLAKLSRRYIRVENPSLEQATAS